MTKIFNEKFDFDNIKNIGITGLTTAYFLKDTSLNIALIEKNHIGSGSTSLSYK